MVLRLPPEVTRINAAMRLAIQAEFGADGGDLFGRDAALRDGVVVVALEVHQVVAGVEPVGTEPCRDRVEQDLATLQAAQQKYQSRWAQTVFGHPPVPVRPSPPPCGWSMGFIATPRTVGRMPRQRLAPALPITIPF